MRTYCLLALLLLPLAAQAESLRSLVKAGNAAYKAGEFDDALNAYRQSQVEAPRNPLGKFNEGAALYRKNEHDSAAAAFRAAALDAKAAGDSRLEAKSLFNLGNTLLKSAEASEKYEPQASVDKLRQGAAAYRQALNRDPRLSAAAENLQIARARLGDLLKQQAQQSPQQSQSSNDLERQIEEQLKKQQELSQDNRESQQQQSESEQQQQAQRQRELQQRSEELSQQTPDNQQAQEQLKQAAAEQKRAAQQLSQGQQEEAGESQEKAERHLAQALQQLRQREGQQPDQQQSQSQPPPSPGQEQGQAQQLQALELTPEDILDQERIARQRRQLLQGQQQRPVEKDW
jgi:hypothetical protein